MAPFEPFEPAPLLVVGVSGGADSLALTLLAEDWVRARGGTLIAVTVDHGLRADSAAEAAEVGRRLAACGIVHETRRWNGGRPGPGLQSKARTARHDLLAQVCEAHGALHLLLAHTADDQAETVLMRFAKGSGVDGLAGIPAVAERARFRILRPLLPLAKTRLEATCAARGLAWLTDPSNADPRFARGRLRAAAAVLTGEGLTAERVGETARRCAGARAWMDQATADLLARTVTLHGEGFAEVDGDRLAKAAPALAEAALAAVVRTIGGGQYPPRRERLLRLAAAVSSGGLAAGRTLGGCRILPGRRIVVCREAAAAAERRPVNPDQVVAWDGRFRVTVPRLDEGPRDGLEVRRLGRAASLGKPDGGRPIVPAAARSALPALWHGDRLMAPPAFGDGPTWSGGPYPRLDCAFVPAYPLTTAGFPVACADNGIM